MTGSVPGREGIARRTWLASALAGLALATGGTRSGRSLAATRSERGDPAFRAFLDDIQARMVAGGDPAGPIERALRGVQAPDPRVVAMSKRQSEFSRPLPAYLAGAASPGRIAKGRALATTWAALLARLEGRYGVPREIVLAIWGLESEFGTAAGGFEVLRSLATLAYIGHRAPLFTDEFVAALRIVVQERGGVGEMLGSWAGAMGQVQFMPSTFLSAAIDEDGDGRRDIWRSVPDSLASIANFLARSGWQSGRPAAFEVTLPAGLDLSAHRHPLATWASRGVTRPGGATLPGAGDANLFLPAGIAGPAFLLTANFEAIRAYNTSDAYALGVVRLADGLAGAGPLSRPWPAGAELAPGERAEIQSRLAARGLYDGLSDGRPGAKTRDAVRRFQLERGLVPDGYADPAVLQALRSPP